MPEAESSPAESQPDARAEIENEIEAGFAELQAGRTEQAEGIYRGVLDKDASHPVALHLLALLLAQKGDHDRAVDLLRRSVASDPEYAAAFYDLGNILRDRAQVDEAERALRRAVELWPDWPEAQYNYGLLLESRRKPGEAVAAYRAAVAAKPDYAKALFSLADLLRKQKDPAAALGATAVLEVQPQLVRLLANLDGVSRVLPRGAPLPVCDYHAPLMSLPLAFATDLSSIPAEVPYLRADSTEVARWRLRIGDDPGLKVGLVWAGDSREHHPDSHREDKLRSMSLAKCAPLAEVDGVRFFSLQKSTVGTSVAHLAGGLGVPTWMLSRYNGCWRWLLDRDDSPWYPSTRLFRQARAGDWREVIERVAAALAEQVKRAS